jgi:AcrR family transcriptional regulator
VPVLGKTKKDVIQEFRTSEILAAARSEFASKGFANATVDGIADRAGIAKGTVYLYFPSKNELFLELLRQGILELHENARREINAALDARGKLRAFLHARIEYCSRNREFFRIYYTEFLRMQARTGRERPEFQDLYEEQARLLESIIETGIRSGQFRKLDVHKVSRLIYEVVRAAVAQHVLEWPSNETEETTALTLGIILGGIGCS